MHNKFLNKFSTFLFYFSILIFIIAFNFTDNPTGGWYQQFMPDLNGAFISDITFTDSLTGYAVTKKNPGNVSYVLKTSNGGDNWNILFTDSREFTKVQFLNNDTGYAGTFYGSDRARLYRTTNRGLNWSFLNNPNSDFEYEDFWVLNTDTIWATYYGVFGGGIYKTTNGGQSWTNQYYVFGNNPDKIYMYNYRIGFMYNQNDSLFKTTNSGTNWFGIPGGAFTDIYFIDSLIGWKANGFMKKTTDGGLSWSVQVLPAPPIGTVVTNAITNFSNIMIDTIWGAGGSIFYNGVGSRGFIYKSTNGGLDWGYQLPDTSFRIAYFSNIQFVTDSIGWAYSVNKGIHTITGGNDTTYFVTSVNQLFSAIPSDYKLYQNYPNPFNPLTKIKYEFKVNSFVKLSVFSIQGKEVKTIVNERQNAGVYEADFSVTEYGSSLSSGVYFYSLIADDKIVDTKKMIVVK